MKKRISIFTLGCRVNAYESLALADSAREYGFEVVKWGEKADIAVINSCALTVLAQAKTRQAVRNFSKNNPSAKIAITGCYAQVSPEDLKKIDAVEWIIPNIDKLKTISIICNDNSSQSASITDNGFIDDRVNLKIQDGCDNFCAYCIIPRARGLPLSRSFDDIISDARNLVSRGAREIILTGINMAKFNWEGGKLPELCDEISKIDELIRIRIGSLEPNSLNDILPLVERAADPSHKLQPHLHISAQSLSNRVLKAMRRKNSVEDFLDIVNKATLICPDISIGTDIICGHPFEREEDYLETKEKLSNSQLAYAHVFTFSPRPKTVAATMQADTPPTEIRKQRADNLRISASELKIKFMESQRGKERLVLLENQLADGSYLAHTDNYLQVATSPAPKGMKNKLALVRLGKSIGAERMEAKIVEIK